MALFLEQFTKPYPSALPTQNSTMCFSFLLCLFALTTSFSPYAKFSQREDFQIGFYQFLWIGNFHVRNPIGQGPNSRSVLQCERLNTQVLVFILFESHRKKLRNQDPHLLFDGNLRWNSDFEICFSSFLKS